MKKLPENVYDLTPEQLAKLPPKLLALVGNASIEAKDRINAAKLLVSIVDQIFKIDKATAPVTAEEVKVMSEPDCPLERLRVVG
jgi:hypothetical protein